MMDGKHIRKYMDKIYEILDKDKSGKISVSTLFSFLEYHLEGGTGFYEYCDHIQDNDISEAEIFEIMEIN